MAKLLFFCIVAILVIYAESLTKDCPVSSKMTSCSPKCKDDTECLGQKCCPNICNAKSCTAANQGGNTANGYKGNTDGATGAYCGNVKCNSYEKCELDRSSKKQKCTRKN